MDMKKYLITTLLCSLSLLCHAQTDSLAFKGTLRNTEHQVYLKINFLEKNITIPGQEIFGEMPGYLGDMNDGRKWLITDVTIEGNTAYMEIINDYGSEDLVAELSLEADGSYTLRQKEGSTMKIARNRKWVKLPKQMKFQKK